MRSRLPDLRDQRGNLDRVITRSERDRPPKKVSGTAPALAMVLFQAYL